MYKIIRRLTVALYLFFAVFPYSSVFSQEQYITINSIGPVSKEMLNILKPIKKIDANDKLNEQILDLVKVSLVDSILSKKTEHHRVFGGRFIRILGFDWRTINWRKEKYIGTSIDKVRIPRDERFTEYDINFNLTPHLKKYIDLAFSGYKRQQQIGKKKRKIDYGDHPPFTYPTDTNMLDIYHLHCEMTPLRPYRGMLNQMFYPVIEGFTLKDHVNFGSDYPTLGMYGPFISDCNHDCHPEIHPYEWLWWLRLNNDTGQNTSSRTWLVGLFREGSNRMPHWSKRPRTGSIAIPFIWKLVNGTLKINIEHLVYGRFNKKGFKLIENDIPLDARDFNFSQRKVVIRDKNNKELGDILLTTNNPINSVAFRYWFSDINFDQASSFITGWINFALSVNDLYTSRITISNIPEPFTVEP